MAYPHKLPDLGYSYDALEPHIDAKTMEIHHGKHHNAYTTKLNAALEEYTDYHGYTSEQLLRGIDALPEGLRTAVRNQGGGHYNHGLFWDILKPGGSDRPQGELASAIDQTFGSFEEFKKTFNTTAAGRFGSGWGWLTVGPFGKLHVISTLNQDSPLMDGHTPIMGVDVWEHAYYLTYQNRRPDYLEAIWNVINWDEVGRRYEEAKGGWIDRV